MTEVMNSTMLNIITKDLSKPLVGSDQEVNDINQRQEKLCLFLISILKLLKDQTIMRLLINCGVSQALTDIFKYRELNQITQTFSSTFDQIVITAEIDSRKLIYEKKPFEGLTKLLTHQNEQIVSDALNSYLNIIIAGSKTSNEQLPHPYLNEIIQCGGIQAINSIFQNTKQNKDMKDKSAIIIGRLYRAKQLEDQMKKYIIDHLKTLLCDPNIQTMKDGKEAIIDLGQNQVNRAEILSMDFLKKIAEDLRVPLDGNEKEINEIDSQQSNEFELLNSLLRGKEDNQIRINIINSKIIEYLIRIFELGIVYQILPPFSETFLIETQASNEIINKLIDLKPFEGLLQLLGNNQNQIVQSHSINSLFNIIISQQSSQTLKQTNPLFETIQEFDGIQKLFNNFQRNQNKEMKDKIAICIGILEKERLIDNEDIKKDIVIHLNELTQTNDYQMQRFAQQAFDGIVSVFFNRVHLPLKDQLQIIAQDLKRLPQRFNTHKLDNEDIIHYDLFFIIFQLQKFNEENLGFELAKLVYNVGIYKAILDIFETRDLDDIPIDFFDFFKIITISFKNTEIFQLSKKNFYPILMRMFNYSDLEGIQDILEGIAYIINLAEVESRDGSTHPHFNLVAQFNGIERILELFRRAPNNQIRNFSAACMGILYRKQAISDPTMRREIIVQCRSCIYDKDVFVEMLGQQALYCLSQSPINRNEFLIGVDLQAMAYDLGKPLNGNEEQIKEIIRIQDCHCSFLRSVGEGEKNDQFSQQILISPVGNSVIRLIETREISTINMDNVKALTILLQMQIYNVRKPKYLISPLYAFAHLLDHNNIKVLEETLKYLIITCQSGKDIESDYHPYYAEAQQYQTINKLYSIFQRKLSDESKDLASLCIGYLYSGRRIPNRQMQRDIILHLIRLYRNYDGIKRTYVRIALLDLALESNNKQAMMDIGFDPLSLV